MKRLETTPQPQAASVHIQPVANRSGAVGVKQPKVPAGISVVGTGPQAAVASRPMAAPVGKEPLVAAGTLQFGEAEGPQLSGGPGAANSAAPSCSFEEAWVNAKEVIVRQALEERDPMEALRILDRGYGKSSPEVQKLIHDDTITRFIVAEAVKKTTVALTDQTVKVIDPNGRPANEQARADDVITRIDQLVRDFDGDFAGIVVNEAMSTFREYYQSCQSHPYSRLLDDSVLGYVGVVVLASLADRIAGWPDGDAAIAGFAAMKAWNGEAMFRAIASGTGKAYAAAYGHLVETQTRDAAFVHRSLAASSMAQLHRLLGFAADHSDALGKHSAQMSRIADDFALFPAARYKKAMDAYRASMDAGWQFKETALEHTIVRDGRDILRHMTALNKVAQETGITDDEIRAEWEAIADDPKASNAIWAALENDPDLVKGEGLKEVAGLLELHRKEPGPTGKLAFLIVRMTNVAATAFLRRTVLKQLNGLKPGDPASAQKIAEAINGLRNQWFAKILGLSEADLNQAISMVTKASTEYANNTMLLETGTDAAKIAQLDQAATKEFLDGMKQLESRVAAFSRATVAGKTMLGLVVSVAIGLNLRDSYQAMMEKPDWVKKARTVDLALLGAQRASALLVGLGVDPTSPVGRYAALKLGEIPGIGRLPFVGRLVGSKLAGLPIGEVYLQVYAVLEAVNAARSAFGWGVPQDTIQAGLSGASAVGFGLAFARVYGVTEWGGWWGMAVAAAAARGQMVYDEVKAAHQDEEKIKICLKAAGVESDRSAGVFSQQMSYQSSVPGHTQLPFLSEYAVSRNLDVVDWINSLAWDQVDRLSAIAQMEINNGQETPSQYAPQPVSPAELAHDKAFVMDRFERELILHQVIAYKPILQGQAKP